ncbi:GAP family protein [Pseudomonas aeruginosa]|nr:GAP family protein [Pseudomonas aeruginosa]
MTIALLLAVSGLALADSLNPFTVAAQAYLLGTKKPMVRSLVFLVATFVTYLLGGFLLLQGWTALISSVLPRLPWWSLGVSETLLGLVLLGFAIWSLKRAKTGKPFEPPKDLSLTATVAFAVGSTVADLSSALPYFAAVNRIAAELQGFTMQAATLAWYNLLYVAPLIVLVAARELLSAERSEKLFGRITGGINWAFAKLLPPVILIGGGALAFDGLRRLLSA